VQALSAGQATAGGDDVITDKAGISGVGWTCHLVPFQRSASNIPPALVEVNPTAVQAVRPGHATAASPWFPGGLGVGWIFQPVPFQRSASVPAGLPKLLKTKPTEIHADGPVQATPPSEAPGALCGLGVGWTLHLLPFQRSATVCTIPSVKWRSPVVVQADGEVQEMPPRKVCTAPAGLGVGRMLQTFPFQRSVRGLTGPPWEAVVLYAPAAMQNDGEVHETPPRPLKCPAAGVGTCWIRHLVPFQRSASSPEFDPPTAKHAKRDAQETAFRETPGTVAIGWFCQLVPFQYCATADVIPRVGPAVPTAKQFEVDGQAMLFSWVSAAPAGFGVPWSRHPVPFQRCAIVKGVPEPCEYPNAVHADERGQATPSRTSPCPPPGLRVRWIVHRWPFQRSASVKKPPEALP
jgi:hypothetical protein